MSKIEITIDAIKLGLEIDEVVVNYRMDGNVDPLIAFVHNLHAQLKQITDQKFLDDRMAKMDTKHHGLIEI